MKTTASVTLDRYILDSLMPDLVGHDRRPAAFLLYLWLAGRAQPGAGLSLRDLAAATGLSKSAVQRAIRHLKRRGLVATRADGPTAAPRYLVHKPWMRNRA